ncbi:MAG: FtsW/RodA/SpoVE family cell cycle protein [Chlamydiae bacterium]|nr:FtsW/RodA/SpoVE family cell cycle protein [Chlamydiota bacterium]
MQYTLYFRRLDYRFLFLLIFMMIMSLLVIASTAQVSFYREEKVFFTVPVLRQLGCFILGWGLFFLLSYFDYRNLRKLCPLLYVGTLVLLVGLFFTEPIQNVRRWYRLPGMGFQVSEYAKVVLVITLSYFLEKKAEAMHRLSTLVQVGLLVFIPFLLIVKQPDLGTALVLLPITAVMLYFGGAPKKVLFFMGIGGLALLGLVVAMFLGVLSHETLKPTMLKVMKEYQYERLNPSNYHQKAAQIAIALGGWGGSGWGEAEYTGKHWLPFAETDSVFPALTEQFGFVGGTAILMVFFGLIYFSFQVTALAKDLFGRLLSSGIAVYLGIHVIVNVGMMCGLLPITGVPLPLISYGGSSVMATMAAFGILQSVYVRRYMF